MFQSKQQQKQTKQTFQIIQENKAHQKTTATVSRQLRSIVFKQSNFSPINHIAKITIYVIPNRYLVKKNDTYRYPITNNKPQKSEEKNDDIQNCLNNTLKGSC